MNNFELSRNWFNFSYENPDLIRPIHTAIYFFALDHANRMGNKEKFGFPTTMVMEAIGVKSYNTYIDAFSQIVEWGFIKLIEKSKNQFSSNIIAISKNNKALDKALDKALITHSIKHTSKQSESTEQSIVQSTDSIIKQVNNKTNKQINTDFILPDINFKEIVDQWLVYRRDLKKQYRTQKGVENFYLELKRLSDNSPVIAQKIINKSISNEWQGIFELKDSDTIKLTQKKETVQIKQLSERVLS
jgi:hypothetical protein